MTLSDDLGAPVDSREQTRNKYWLWLIARLFLGSIFIVAGFLKLSGPVEIFRGMIVSYGIVPYPLVAPIAYVLPWVEFLSGVCLIIGYFPRFFAGVLGVLAFSFIALIALAQVNGTLPENCGCFGEGVHMTPYQMALLDTLNVFLALKLCQIKTHFKCLSA